MLPRGSAWLYSDRVAEPEKPAPESEDWWREVLISEDALANAEFSGETLERRELTLRGRTATIAIRSGTVDSLGPVVT
jgi:hypothetical protein